MDVLYSNLISNLESGLKLNHFHKKRIDDNLCLLEVTFDIAWSLNLSSSNINKLIIISTGLIKIEYIIQLFGLEPVLSSLRSYMDPVFSGLLWIQAAVLRLIQFNLVYACMDPLQFSLLSCIDPSSTDLLSMFSKILDPHELLSTQMTINLSKILININTN